MNLELSNFSANFPNFYTFLHFHQQLKIATTLLQGSPLKDLYNNNFPSQNFPLNLSSRNHLTKYFHNFHGYSKVMPIKPELKINRKKFDFRNLAKSCLENDDNDKIDKRLLKKLVCSTTKPLDNVQNSQCSKRGVRGPGRSRKEYICRFCNRHFTKSYNLLIHERTHTDERPFPCDICGKAFRRQDHLRDHKYIHCKEKPYKCEICGKGFCQPRSFTSHKLLHQ